MSPPPPPPPPPPRLLEQHRHHYAALPREDELVLITSVLGASADWLAQALIKEALTAGRPVVFVAFMRDWDFHAECVRKLGVDLAQHVNKGTFAFVDGLSRFFLPPGPGQSSNVALELVAAGGIKGVTAGITQVVRKLARPLPLLILENLDFMLAAAGEGVGALDMADMVLDLRELCHSMIVLVNADAPFVGHPRTRLEVEHAAFVVALGHGAAWTVALRLLDTGVARDVSGVIRITRGGEGEGEEKEVLYYVGDGAVEVFDRGQMRG